MAPTAEERDRDKLMNANGWRLLLIGGIGALIGFFVMFFVGPGPGPGATILAFATVPTIAGLAMIVSTRIAKRADEDKPFA
ncbi:MAG: hypothetical protein M3P40_00505 [Actinomycetota bacterium]|nr:hypothetical protein [Actinomycetota bacterium]